MAFSCPEHARDFIIVDAQTATEICTQCGFVISSSLDGNYLNGDEIGRESMEIFENPANRKQASTVIISPLRHLNLIRNKKTNNIGERGKEEISKLCENLHLPPSIKNKSELLFREIISTRTTRWGSGVLVAASVYSTAKRNNLSRSMREILNYCDSDVSSKLFRRCFLYINKNFPDPDQNISSPAEYIPRWSRNIGLSGASISRCLKLITQIENHDGVRGRSPLTVGATVLYFIGQLEEKYISQRTIAKHSGVSISAISGCYSKMKDYLISLTA